MSHTIHPFFLTPPQVEGPFYPAQGRQHKSNHLRPQTKSHSAGHAIIIAGHLRNTQGKAIDNALIEIWQADHHGRYDHPNDHNHPHPVDKNFQYTGQCTTNASGCYTFLTIKPGPYNDHGDWRTPHIHFKVYPTINQCALTTQMYFKGEALNNQDHHLNQLPPDHQKRLLATARKTGANHGFDSTQTIHEFDITIVTSS